MHNNLIHSYQDLEVTPEELEYWDCLSKNTSTEKYIKQEEDQHGVLSSGTRSLREPS